MMKMETPMLLITHTKMVLKVIIITMITNLELNDSIIILIMMIITILIIQEAIGV